MKRIKALFLAMITTMGVLFVTAQSPNMDFSNIGDNDVAGHHIKLRGFNLYYETYGTGKPVLFIHGNGGSISNFMYQVPYFARTNKVIIADSRAQGKSVDKGDSLSYEMMADDLDALLDTLHLDSCNVVGWNDGAVTGLLLAIRHPNKVGKLAVSGAKLWSDTSAVDLAAYNWAAQYNASFEKLSGTSETKNKHKVARLLSYEPHLHIEQLQKIQCPALIIGGDHDVILLKHTLLIASSIPKAYVWILPGSGNSTHISYKDQFNEVISNFFNTPYKKIEGLDRFN